MRTYYALALALLLLATGTLIGNRAVQAQDGSNQELLALVRALEKRLGGEGAEEPAAAARPANTRTTEIGNTTQAPAAPPAPTLIVRLYDLSDLFAIAPPYPATYQSDLAPGAAAGFPAVPGDQEGGFGGGGLGGGGLFSVADSRDPVLRQFGGGNQPARGNLGAARVSLDELIQVITKTIRPGDWEPNGGEATISRLGNALLVSAPAATHEQIDNLLKLFRERWGTLRTISVRAHWLWLTDGQLDAVLSSAIEEPPVGYGVLTDEQWAQAQELTHQNADLAGYRAAITFYNGQTVHTLSGGQRLAVIGITPSVGGEVVGYAPDTSVIQTGAALQITGMTTRKGEFVVLDLHSRVSTVRAVDSPAETAAGEASIVPAVTSVIDRSQISVQRLSTTLRIPVNRTMLVGGMSVDEQPAPGSPSLYLFIRAMVQELRDDKE